MIRIKEIYYEIIKDVSSSVVYLTIFVAFAGLVIYSLRGISKDNFELIFFFIGTAITLSGFTMLSGVMEKKKIENKIERNLFFLSILFLCSAFSFILFIGLYSLFKDAVMDTWPKQIWNYLMILTYYLGFIPFIFGFAILIIVLVKHYQQIK